MRPLFGCLNALWKLGLTEQELKTLGGVGADVPVFISGKLLGLKGWVICF